MFGFLVSKRMLAFLAAYLVAQTPADAAPTSSVPGCRYESNPPIVIGRILAPTLRRLTPAAARADIALEVTRGGSAHAVHLVRSSGETGFDRAALDATRNTRFMPAATQCVRLDSRFTYIVSREPGGPMTAMIASVVPNSPRLR